MKKITDSQRYLPFLPICTPFTVNYLNPIKENFIVPVITGK
jgi:hypothetical protein